MKCFKNKDSSLKESLLNYVSACDFCGANSTFICSYLKNESFL